MKLVLRILTSVTFAVSTSSTLAESLKYQFPAAGVAYYVGVLTDSDVDQFISAAKDKNIKELMITSQGGSILAGVQLGRWVRSNRVEVVVDRLCMSSCANYVFPAGKGKIIRPGSLVIWHGGAEQKDFRELRERMSRIVRAKSLGETVSIEDEAFHADNTSPSKLWDVQTLAQKELFAELGVDEYITRLGQEPVFYGKPWTTTIETMKLFGIDGILADDRYGSGEYLAKAAKSIGLNNIPMVLSATRSGPGTLIQVLSD